MEPNLQIRFLSKTKDVYWQSGMVHIRFSQQIFPLAGYKGLKMNHTINQILCL